MAALCILQKTVCKFCEIIGHNADARIISGPYFLPPIFRINMNQFNIIHSDETTEKTREWNRQPPPFHFKYRYCHTKTSPVAMAILGILNHHAVDNDDVEVCSSYYPIESTSDSVSDTYPTKKNQFMIMKWTNLWTSSNKITMMIFLFLPLFYSVLTIGCSFLKILYSL